VALALVVAEVVAPRFGRPVTLKTEPI